MGVSAIHRVVVIMRREMLSLTKNSNKSLLAVGISSVKHENKQNSIHNIAKQISRRCYGILSLLPAAPIP
jgi:hypothetical protein